MISSDHNSPEIGKADTFLLYRELRLEKLITYPESLTVKVAELGPRFNSFDPYL